MSNSDYNSNPDLPPPLPARRPTAPTVTEDAKPYYLASNPSAEENNELEDQSTRQRIPTIVTPQKDTETAGSPTQRMPSPRPSASSYPDGPLSPKSKTIAPSTSGLTTATAHTAHTAHSGKTKEEVTFEFDRHVQEIRRRRTVARRPPPPDKDDYTRIEDESGKQVLDVGLYVQANVTYFIKSLARDDKVKKIEPLQWKRMRGLLSRLYDTSNPVQSLGLYIERVMLWKNPPETFIWFTVYFTLWFYKLWLPAFISLFVIKILNNRYGFLGDFKEKLNVPASLSDKLNAANDNDVKRKSKIHSQLRDLIHSKDLTDWISQMTKIWGPYCQALLEENVNYLERVRNLFRWERPEQTWRVVALLSFYIFISTFFQFLVLPAIGYAIGVEYFILLPMQHYYPRYSHLFSPVEWILWDVPTNAELAVEMLTRQREGAEGIDDTIEPTAHDVEVEQDSASVAGLSPASKIKHEYQKRIRGMSLSGTSVTSESSSADNTDGIAQDKNEFHCMMRGKPGKLVITEEAILFRAARLLGRDTEVQISWGDVDSVKKSRTMNVGLWSMPGIDVTDIDGKVTVFQNVVKRDDAFRKMVLTSGKKWSSVP